MVECPVWHHSGGQHVSGVESCSAAVTFGAVMAAAAAAAAAGLDIARRLQCSKVYYAPFIP